MIPTLAYTVITSVPVVCAMYLAAQANPYWWVFMFCAFWMSWAAKPGRAS